MVARSRCHPEVKQTAHPGHGLQKLIRLVGCVLRPIDSEVIKRRHPHLLSLPNDVKLGKYTVPTENRNPGHRVAVHYATAAPYKLHQKLIQFMHI